ncbi:MAG: methylenetetrahydrofolate reductase [Actinomycetota bacterium]|nr:methylenetetrahydrofolate reductase [Actinomycetota bacterium]
MADTGFEIVCEIEPPTSAEMAVVREQIAVLKRTCDAFLVPDSHLGRATVSSVAVAHEVAYLQGRAIACLNARDRNLLGFQRDLLTAAAYGVRELLFVYGDPPSRGDRSTLTVRAMLEQVSEENVGARVGVAADLRREWPEWKHAADFVFTQMSFDPTAVARWRDRSRFNGRVYAGVVVLASDKMAHRLARLIPGFDVPHKILQRLGQSPNEGIDIAIEQIQRLREDGVVDGVHLIPARRYRQTAEALEAAGI